MNEPVAGWLTAERLAELISLRRDLHRHPELSGCEAETAHRVVEALADLPLKVTANVAGHGLVADLDGGHPGPTIAFRADMDALPIHEESDVDYRSTAQGVMHACGHDVHTTIGVGLTRAMAARRDHICGRVRFIFQPAEEAAPPPGQVVGAEAMARQGVLDGVDAILAVHCKPDLHVEHFAVPEGAAWATSDIFNITLRGHSAHGAKPHQGIDAVQMAASVAQALLALPGRVSDPLSPCVLTIGRLQAGTTHNVLAGEAKLSGIVRTFDADTRATALAAAERLVTQIAAGFGGEADIRVQEGAKAVINHRELTGRVRALLLESLGAEGIADHPPQMASEDFSAFSNRVPGCYLYLGTRNEKRGITHLLHTSLFDVDEACIPYAVEHIGDLLLRLGRTWSPLGVEAHS